MNGEDRSGEVRSDLNSLEGSLFSIILPKIILGGIISMYRGKNMRQTKQMMTFLFTILTITAFLWFEASAFSYDEGKTVINSSEGILIQGENISVPDGIDFTGNGTEQDPYIFSSMWMNNTEGPGICINGSSSHIIIRDTFVTYGIYNMSDGIFISNTTNITIVDSLFQNCYIGVHLENSSNIQVIGSALSGNRYGAVVRNSPGNEFTDCSVNGNMIDGMLLENSEGTVISYCEMVSNSARIANDAAIRVVRSSDSIILIRQ